MPAPKEVADLVEKFEIYIGSYKSSQYNETQIRQEIIDPLFEVLGWDIDNVQGYAEAYKEVIPEDAIKVDESTRAPENSSSRQRSLQSI